MEVNNEEQDNRTFQQIFIDMQNLLKLTEEDVKKSMTKNVSAGIRVRHVMTTIKEWSLLVRKLIRDQNGKYYEYKGKRPKGVIGRKKSK